MNILLLNRHWEPLLMESYVRVLESEGHVVASLCSLEDDSEYRTYPEKYMSKFHRAIVHPTADDAKSIYRELQRRPELKAVIFNIEGNDEMNGRLRYMSAPMDRESLLKLLD